MALVLSFPSHRPGMRTAGRQPGCREQNVSDGKKGKERLTVPSRMHPGVPPTLFLSSGKTKTFSDRFLDPFQSGPLL